MNAEERKPTVIILAEDDEDDYLLTKDAFREAHLLNDLHRVADGQELIEYLRREGRYNDPREAPRPCLILLDLNMPRKDGREALKEIKADPELCQIPVVVLTTSKSDEDIVRSYRLGVSSYIRKPTTFDQLVNVMSKFKDYWFQIVQFP